MLHNDRCFANHLGKWMVQPDWFCQGVEAVKVGTWPMVDAAARDSEGDLLYETVDGIAIIPISGPMMKGKSKFGGTSTVQTRQAVRQAIRDTAIGGIALYIDSPGGTVAGTAELANDVRVAGESKPLFAHFEDLCASAAYWVGSQARQLSASATTEVGSIGVVAVVIDSSKRAEMAGIQVHVISTGEFKGAFAHGAPITDDMLAQIQTRVDDLNEHFLGAIATGRRMSMKSVRGLADGRIHIASKALEMRMIDKVQSFDDTIGQLQRLISKQERTARQSARVNRELEKTR